MFNILLMIFVPLCISIIIQMDRLYPKVYNNFLMYYAWAFSFCNFLLIFKILINLLVSRFSWKPTGFIAYTTWHPLYNMEITWNNKPVVEYLSHSFGTWINCEWLCVDWYFIVDVYELIMLSVVTFISAMVQLYSLNYMVFDDYKKFTAYISFFTFFMLVLVSAGNFVVLFLGWEGVGLCSYLLINFWYTRINANLAAMKALIINRIADMALTISIILIFLTFLSVDFDVVFPLVPFFLNENCIILDYDINIITLIAFLIFIGAMGKSAQIGLHTWLPDAMEGPTPVSALIHAATMVTAGVFLLIKCSPLFEYVPSVLHLIIFVGAFTAFFSAMIGLVQNDIKKIIAYSTCSQLGYMIFCCGISAYDVSFFHLINHAFFKALLFLGAGSIIHSVSNEQDLRKYGLTIQTNAPFVYIIFLIGSLALMGFPFLTGFYSKDLILEIAHAKYTVTATFSYFVGILTAFLTSIYSFRIIYLTYIFEKNIFRRFFNFDTSIFFSIPLVFLALGSLFFGYITKDLFVGLGSDALAFNIFILPENNIICDAEFFGWTKICQFWWVKLIPFILINCALFVIIIINTIEALPFQKTTYIQNLLSKAFFFDIFNNKFFANSIILFVAYDFMYKYFDKIIFEVAGPLGISSSIYQLSTSIRKAHYGVIFIYILYFLILIIMGFIIPLLYNNIFGIL